MAIHRALTGRGYPAAFVDLEGAAGITDRWRDGGSGYACKYPDLAQLAALACQVGPSLLTEQDGFYAPGDVGLAVIHPSSGISPAPQATKNRAHLMVATHGTLDYLARSIDRKIEAVPGWWPVLLISDRAALGHLISTTGGAAA